MLLAPRTRARAGGGLVLAGLFGALAASPSPAAIYLQDNTVIRGITGAYTAHDPADFAEVRGGGAAVLDYDQDGDEDLYVTNNADRPNELYRNDGGTFVDVAASAHVAYGPRCLGTLAADLDNDGDPELLLLNEGPNILYRNENNGTFVNRSALSGLSFSSKTSYSAAVADYDLDGDLDIYIVNWHLDDPVAAANELWRNEGNLRFVDVTASAGVGDPAQGLAAIWHDIDLDGDADLMSINEFTHDMLYRNEGNGTFSDVTFDVLFTYNDVFFADGMGVHIADADLDGLQDIYVTNYGKNNLFMNNGDGTFTDEAFARGCSGPTTVPWVGWGTEFFDCDLDGDLDIYVNNGRKDGGTSYNDLYLNNGSGSFTRDSAAGGPNHNFVGRGLVMSDFDADGDQDIFIINHDTLTQPAHNCYLENVNATANHWLQVRTRGIVSNSEGVGARVIVESGGTQWIREVTIGSSYASSSSPTLTFGLGSRTTVDLRVEWPSGIVDDITGIAVDRKVVVVEGEGSVVAVGDAVPPMRPRLAVWPNPARRAGTIVLHLDTAADVRLGAFAPNGRLVRTLVDGPLAAGAHTIGWDGRSSDGRAVAPGVYFLKLEHAGRVTTHRLVQLD